MKNEYIYGPLQLFGEFDYSIIEAYQNDQELLNYINHIDQENKSNNSDNNTTDIFKLHNDSIFTRMLKLNMEYINPIIGLITIQILNNTYNITHISIHKSFRGQGLAKLLLMTFANYIENNKKYNLITIILSENINKYCDFFRNLDFNETIINSNYHMIQDINKFCKIINNPI